MVAYRTYEDFPYEDLLTYAGIDCLVTSELLAKTAPIISERPAYVTVSAGKEIPTRIMSIYQSMKQYTMPFLDFICDLEINGIKYNVERNQVIKLKMEEEINELESLIFSSLGSPLDLNSGKVLSHFLYEIKGFEPPSLTKTGEPSTDGDAMKELARTYTDSAGWLNAIGKRNDIASAYRSFVRNYVQEHVKRDGRVHPSYNLQGTSSFRITGDNPNLTQLPRAKHGYNIRELFTVDSGNVFIAFDFSSAEVKVLGALCRDPMMLKAIREGLDFHSFSASVLYGIPYDEFIAVISSDENTPLKRQYKEMRQTSKALTFGVLYGSSPMGVASSMGVSLAKAQELIALYFNTYPKVEEFVNDSHRMAELNHYIVTPFGQRKMQFGARPEFKYTAAYNAAKRNSQNVRIQSPTSSLGLVSFSELNTRIKQLGGKSLCTVYDSIELEVPIEKAAEAVELGFYCMNDLPQQLFSWLDFPIGVEAEIGYNWGNTRVVHRGVTQEQILGMLH